MKKGMIAVLTAAVIGGGMYGVNATSAAEEEANLETPIEQVTELEGREKLKHRLNFLKEHKDELQARKEMKSERLEIRKQIGEKKDQLLDLALEASLSEDSEKATEVNELRQQMKAVQDEITAIHEEMKEKKPTSKEDRSEEKFEELRLLGEQVNEKLQDELEILDQLIALLSE